MSIGEIRESCGAAQLGASRAPLAPGAPMAHGRQQPPASSLETLFPGNPTLQALYTLTR
jgi:hypothetical protein